MPEHDEKEDIRKADSRNVALCVRALNQTIGQLANRYGTSAVVAALTDVMGCASCVEDVNRGTRVRALMERIGVIR
jgi:hypothetical protein